MISVLIKTYNRSLPINICLAFHWQWKLEQVLRDVQNGLRSFKGVKGDFIKFISKNKSTVIDDSYNANPMSMKSSIQAT